MRSIVSSALELVGLSALVAGSWVQFGAGWGMMVGGATCVAVGVRSAL